MLAFFQALAAQLTGPLGIAAMTSAIAASAVAAAYHMMRWSHVFETIAAGAVVFAAAWIITTFYGVAG